MANTLNQEYTLARVSEISSAWLPAISTFSPSRHPHSTLAAIKSEK